MALGKERTRRARRVAAASRATPQPAASGETPQRTPATRWQAVDLLRGIALMAMIVYHFCFDLAWHGWLKADFGEDLHWIWFRIPILASFLLLAGLSLALAEAHRQAARHFWRRVGVIALAAALVSAGSYAMFAESFIYFGVLHAIALMSVLARPLLKAGLGRALLPLGIIVIAIGNLVQSPVFDAAWLNWIGMMTFKPRTEDYVPLFPWFGMMLLGAGAGVLVLRARQLTEVVARWQPPRPLRWIRWMGRHSLVIYLIHQPLLLGAMMLVPKQ